MYSRVGNISFQSKGRDFCNIRTTALITVVLRRKKSVRQQLWKMKCIPASLTSFQQFENLLSWGPKKYTCCNAYSCINNMKCLHTLKKYVAMRGLNLRLQSYTSVVLKLWGLKLPVCVKIFKGQERGEGSEVISRIMLPRGDWRGLLSLTFSYYGVQAYYNRLQVVQESVIVLRRSSWGFKSSNEAIAKHIMENGKHSTLSLQRLQS